MLDRLGVDSTEIRLPQQLDDIDGLIIPGGESTTIVQLIDIYDFRETLRQKVESGMRLWGTCAGMIVISNKLTDHRPEPLHLMNIDVSRNAFGRQVDSFVVDLDVPALARVSSQNPPFSAVFIRAPLIESLNGDDVQALSQLDDGRVVAAQQGHFLATAFHPELSDDDRFHRYFVQMVDG